jgi:hypothetical protein
MLALSPCQWGWKTIVMCLKVRGVSRPTVFSWDSQIRKPCIILGTVTQAKKGLYYELSFERIVATVS